MISVIVPIYNAEKFLPKCLDSIKNQTYKDLEIILVNDGSSDGSGLICEKYSNGDKRFIVIHKSNGGVSSARNTALKIAKGKYIGFVDPDDWIEPNMFEKLYNLMNDNQVDMSICGYSKETNAGIILSNSIDKEIKKFNQKQAINEIIDNSSIKGYLWNKLFKADKILNEHKLYFDEKIHFCEDLLFCCQYLLKSESAVFDNTKYYHYIIHEKSVSQSNFNNRKLTALQAISKIVDLLHENKKFLDSKKYINLYMHMNISLLMHGLEEGKIEKNVQKKLKANLFRYKLNSIIDKKVKISCAIARSNLNLYYFLWKSIN